MLAPAGTYLSMGLVTGKLFSQSTWSPSCTRDSPSSARRTTSRVVMPKVLEFLSRTRDKYPFEKLVSHKFKLEDANEGIQQSLAGKVVRAGLVPG